MHHVSTRAVISKLPDLGRDAQHWASRVRQEVQKCRAKGFAECGYYLIGETGFIQLTSTLVGREGVRGNRSLHMFMLLCLLGGSPK